MKNIAIIYTLICTTSFFMSPFTCASPVPDTGQVTCFNDKVPMIPCPLSGNPFFGQDANYIINPKNYIKLDNTGNPLPVNAQSWAMVKDNITGLIWENKTLPTNGKPDYTDPHNALNTYLWYDSNPATNVGNAGTPGNGTDTEDFIKQLNNAKFGGFSDWRLPTIKELTYIIHGGIPSPGPTIDVNFFPNTQPSRYWSSTTYIGDTDYAWGVLFNYGGGSGSAYKSIFSYVRAVRGGQTSSCCPYTDNGDGTVTDTSTGLMWQKDTAGTMNWEHAIAYCEALSLGGYTDWRLPSIHELRSLADYSRIDPSIDVSYFPDTQLSWYWSSTTNEGSTSNTWSIKFNSGGLDGNFGKIKYGYVRAVRGRQNGSLCNCQLWCARPNNVQSWNPTTGQWTIMENIAGIQMIASGDIDGDGLDDLIMVSPTGLSIRFTSNSQLRLLTPNSPTWITSGDLDNDGHKEVIGTWAQSGIFSWNLVTGWHQIPVNTTIPVPVAQLATGKINGLRDDLICIFLSSVNQNQNGLWRLDCTNNQWGRIDPSIPSWIATGDLDGNNKSDILGSYATGTWYRDSATSIWNKITSASRQLAACDMDGDGLDDIVGVWSNGIWIRFSSTNYQWRLISPNIPIWITTGKR